MTDEVIVERIDGLKLWIEEKFKENSKEHLIVMEKQDKTNGRVKTLELWKARLIGAWAVFSILLVGLIIPLVYNYLQTKQQVKAQVDQALSQYFEKVN